MKQEQLADFKARLKTLRAELMKLSEQSEASAGTVELDQTRVGRLSRMDALQGQQMGMESKRRRELQLRGIASALIRIEHQEYGYCEECGE